MKKALIVIDLQNDYFKNGSMELQDIDEALKQTNRLIKFAREQKYKVYFIQHIAIKKEATFFVENTSGVELHNKLEIQSDDIIIQKSYPNSFRDTKLKKELEKESISDLIICGAMTHMCIDTTVRAGFDMEYNIELINDACATKDLEFQEKRIKAKDVQFSFMSALDGVFCEVKNTEQMINI